MMCHGILILLLLASSAHAQLKLGDSKERARPLSTQGFINMKLGSTKFQVAKWFSRQEIDTFAFFFPEDSTWGIGASEFTSNGHFYVFGFIFFDRSGRANRISFMAQKSCDSVSALYQDLISKGSTIVSGLSDSSLVTLVRYKREDVVLTADCPTSTLVIDITKIGKHPDYDQILHLKD